MKRTIRIAAGQGFWGDFPDAPVRQVEGGPIDYLMLDYLAEVTMSIMQKQRSRDPSAGYAKDFVPLMKQILPACVERNIRVTANAGGVNVEGCASAVKEVARELGLAGKVRIGIVTGDDIMAEVRRACWRAASSCATWTTMRRSRQFATASRALTFISARLRSGGTESRRTDCDHWSRYRYRLNAGADDSRVWLGR